MVPHRRDLRTRSPPRSRTGRGSSSCPTGTRPRSWPRSRPCCSPAPSTTTWSARRPAPGRALMVEAGDVRGSTTWPCSSGTARRRSTPTSRWSPWRTRARPGYYVGIEPEKAVANLVKALGKGVLKVMSKMGCRRSRRTPVPRSSRLSGSPRRWSTATSPAPPPARRRRPRHDRRGWRGRHDGVPAARHLPVAPQLEIGGEYQWRREGEPHLFDPETVFRPARDAHRSLRRVQAVHLAGRRAVRAADDACAGLFRLRRGRPVGRRCRSRRSSRSPRSSSASRPGRCRYGSISQEAHETLAIAMNRLGGAKSNTGEGGEDPERLYDPERRSAIKQVASGRFGVTSGVPHQLRRHPDQDGPGREAGEGGQLPGNKGLPVGGQDPALDARRGPDQPAAAPRHLLDRGPRAAHPRPQERQPRGPHPRQAVAEVGVGTVAAGVSKAHADVVLISGHDGGTGPRRSPRSSTRAPWELGLAETQQTLCLNGLRDRIVVQTDGQLKTGRDVVVAPCSARRSSASPPRRWWSAAA